METAIWNADLALGIPLFDEAHQAMAEQVEELLMGPDHVFAVGMARLIAALEEDFSLEESLMEAIGYQDIGNHRRQHAGVLGTLHAIAPHDIAAGRRAATLILPWFQLHLATADTALAIALQKADRPTVLRPRETLR